VCVLEKVHELVLNKKKSVFVVVRKAHFANIFLIIFIVYFPNTINSKQWK